MGYFGLSALGYLLCSRAFVEARDKRLKALWFVGPGFAVGLFLAFLVRLASTKEATLAVVVIATVTVVGVQTRDALKGRIGGADIVTPSALAPRASEVLLSAGLVALPLVSAWTWMLPIASVSLCSAFALDAYAEKFARAKRVMIVIVAAGATLTAAISKTSLQSQTWWMLADDNQLFEATAFRLFESGPAKSVLGISLDGFSAVAYHHLAYFLAGFLEAISNSPNFVALTIIAPLFISLSLISSSFLLAARAANSGQFGSDGNSRIMLGVSLLLISIPIAQVPLSNFLGLLAVVVTLVCALVMSDEMSPWATFVMPTVLLGLVAFSKVTYLYAAALLLLAGGFVSGGHRMRVIASTIVSSGALLGFFAASAVASSDFRISLFNEDSLGEHAFGGPIARLLALFVVLVPLAPGVVAGTMLVVRDGDQRYRVLALASLIVMGVGYLSRFVLGGRIETIRYAWEPAPLLAALTFALLVFRGVLLMPSRRKSQLALAAAISSSLWILVIPHVVPSLDEGSLVAKCLRLLRSPSFLLMLVVILLLFRVGIASRGVVHQGAARRRGNPALLMVALGLYLGSHIATHGVTARERQSEIASGREDQERMAWLPAPNTLEVAEFVRLALQSNEVFAMTLCNPSDDSCFPNDFRLIAIADRRVLSTGGSYVTYWTLPAAARADYELSESLPRIEPAIGMSALQARGVRWLVADRRYVSQDWLSAAARDGFRERFTNDSYTVFEITNASRG